MAGADDIAEFLRRFPPFRDLPPAEVHDLARDVRVASYPRGTVILEQTGAPAPHLFVVRSGTIDLVDEDRILERLREGDVFGISVVGGVGPALTARAVDEAACLLIDADRARSVLGSPAGLAFLTRSAVRWRERDAVEMHVARAGGGARLFEAVSRADDVSALVEASTALPATVGGLLDAGIDAVDVGHVVGWTIDWLTSRLVDLSIAELGSPPAAFAWIALGSAARHEQALSTDQDHALALGCDDRDVDAISPYFEGLAGRVTDGLEACGIRRCSGGIMAENSAWRRTIAGWRARFTEYVGAPEMMGTRVASVAFDYRRVLGPVDIEPDLDEVIRDARADPAFLRRLWRTVTEIDVPVGRLRDVATERGGDYPGTFDVKDGALTVVTNLARYLAIEAGVTENRTIDRLRAATATGSLSPERCEDLVEAFRLFWGIRLRQHLALIERGLEPHDHVDPGDLRPITRRALGAALAVIVEAQKDRRAHE
jgi:signal-transduction protein with cAMP-binding, CBS, and nucleotidyltransferase domain